jgi:hypothetical protein
MIAASIVSAKLPAADSLLPFADSLPLLILP